RSPVLFTGIAFGMDTFQRAKAEGFPQSVCAEIFRQALAAAIRCGLFVYWRSAMAEAPHDPQKYIGA
ncbi:hypothetical protein, partial [Bilophila wadsworthia]|uniref:hypothetical protein n=1 Tax=Bilophila wadsworthia TaxID=35833 RepID=UPI003AAF718D